MASIPQLAHPLSSADMRERRQMPLVRTPSSTSSQASRGGGVLTVAKSLMVAANTANGIGGQRPAVCAMTGNANHVHAAHVLPHSYWSTARQHEWLFYAGAIPNGNARYRGLDKFKYTEKNILWLFVGLAGSMEPTTGELIVVPKLANIITMAEQRLARYEGNELVFDSFTSPELLVEWPQQVMASETTASTFPYSLWIASSKEGELIAFFRALSIIKEGQSTIHLNDASTTLDIPVKYNPPLPAYNLCIDPIIASIVAWTTIRDRLLEGSPLVLADTNTFALLDYFLALCEAGTPSGWRSLTRPDGLPASRPPLPEAAAAEEDNRRRVYMGEDWAPPAEKSQKGSSSQAMTSSSPSKRTHSSDLPGKAWKSSTRIVSGQQKALDNEEDSKAEEAGGMGSSSAAQDGGQNSASDPSSDPSSDPRSEEPDTSLETQASSFASASLFKALPGVSAEEEDEDVRTPDQRWNDACYWLDCKRHQDKRVGRLAKRLEDLEDDFIDEARRIIRLAFGERARRSGFSSAMRWLRGSDADALALDDEVRHIKANFLKVALPMVDAHADDPAPTHNVEAWLATKRP